LGKLTVGGLTAKLPLNDGDHGLRLNFRKLEDLIENIETDGRSTGRIAILFVEICRDVFYPMLLFSQRNTLRGERKGSYLTMI
jgi:hypothetical protein